MRRRPLLMFFVLASLLSWMAWAPLVAAARGWTTATFSPSLHLLGGLGPLVAALITTAACDGRAGLERWFKRCFALRGRLAWVAFAGCAPVLLFVLSAGGLVASGKGPIAWSDVGRSVEYPALGRGAFWIANFVCYGLGEELGWRGFALPRLQARRTALASAMLVGAAWAAWHLPLFAFAAGFASMGVVGAAGWLFSILTGSILLTWLFNSSRGSVLAVALFHGVLDIVTTSPVQSAMQSIVGAAITIWGLALPMIFGRGNLARGPRVKDS